MDGKLDGTVHDEIFCRCMQTLDGETQLVGDTVDDVTEQMVSVDGFYMNGYRIENVLLFLEINVDDAVAILRSQADGIRAVALVNRNIAICLLESDDFFARNRAAVLAAVVG